MLVPRLGQSRSVEFNVTPFIDVVFLLIVFFLVSSHLARQETQIELELPTATTGKEPQESDEVRVTVNVFADGRVLLGSTPVERDEIAQRLEVERNKAGERLEVRIRAHRDVEYRHVEPVLLACARAGVWNVSFAVVREPGQR